MQQIRQLENRDHAGEGRAAGALDVPTAAEAQVCLHGQMGK